MSRRWIRDHAGRVASVPAIAPAKTTISAFAVSAMPICVAPSSSICSATEARPGSTNCGSSAT